MASCAWAVDAAVDSVVFGEGEFIETLQVVGSKEVYVRAMAALLVGGLVYGLIQRRRAEVVHARLIAEQKDRQIAQLRALSEVNGAFLNSAAHELNTPLTPLKIQFYMLDQTLDPILPEKIKNNWAILRRSVERLSNLVGEILDASRAQAGRLKVRNEPVRIEAAVRDAVESFQANAAEMGVNLVASLPEEPLAAYADSRRLDQILLNLISNALKYTPPGGNITVQARNEGPEVILAIQDTGIGMSNEQISRLFQPFSQVQEPVAGMPGTGLGLFVSRSLAEAQGGRLWCESRGTAQGSTFFLALPMASPQALSGALADHPHAMEAPVAHVHMVGTH